MTKFVRPFAFLIAAALVSAQAPVGTISGTVNDSAGAVVPNATIVITNRATGNARTLSSNAEGLYSAPALAPGEYELRVEAPGFLTLVRDAQVVAGSTTTVGLPLTIGA